MKFYSYSVDKRENLVYNKGRKESRLNMKKVRSSRVSGLTEIICDDNTDVDKIVSTIKNDGYDVKEVKVSDFEKHGLFLKF